MPDEVKSAVADDVRQMAQSPSWGRGAVAAGHTGDFVMDPVTGERVAASPGQAAHVAPELTVNAVESVKPVLNVTKKG